MATYKLHFFGHREEPEETCDLVCASDAEAINTLHDRDDGRAMELWECGRKVLWWPGRPGRRARRG